MYHRVLSCAAECVRLFFDNRPVSSVLLSRFLLVQNHWNELKSTATDEIWMHYCICCVQLNATCMLIVVTAFTVMPIAIARWCRPVLFLCPSSTISTFVLNKFGDVGALEIFRNDSNFGGSWRSTVCDPLIVACCCCWMTEMQSLCSDSHIFLEALFATECGVTREAS